MIQALALKIRLTRIASLIIVLALCSASSIAQNPSPTGQPLEPPPYNWPRSHNYDVQHYRIAVSFDWAKQSVSGETTIVLQPIGSDVKEFEIDAGDMKI